MNNLIKSLEEQTQNMSDSSVIKKVEPFL